MTGGQAVYGYMYLSHPMPERSTALDIVVNLRELLAQVLRDLDRVPEDKLDLGKGC